MWHVAGHIILKLHLLLCFPLALKLELRRDGITSSVAAGNHGGYEGTLECSYSHLRKPGIIYYHLRLVVMVLCALVKRQACFCQS